MIVSVRRAGACLAGALIPFLAACAEMAPPPGGPPDVIAPTIVAATPESLATGVDPASPLVVTFSERVSKDLLADWTFIRPFRRIDSIDWEGPVATITFRGGLPPDTTVSFEIGDGVADRRGNRLARPIRRTFATGVARLSPGVVAGEVRRTRAAGQTLGGTAPPGPARNVPATGTSTGPAQAIFVWAYRAVADTLPDLATTDPDYLTQVAPSGTFRLDGLPTGVPLRVFAFFDSDRSRTFTPERDYATRLPDPLTLTDAAPALTDLVIFLIDPKAAGSVSGRIVPPADTTQVDTLSYGVILSTSPAEGDTAGAGWPPLQVAKQTIATKAGTFTIRGVPPGTYRVAPFVDLDKNGKWTRTEPLGPPVRVTVRPDEESGNVEFARPRAGP